MISRDFLLNAVYKAIVKASVEVPEDVRQAFHDSVEKETSQIAKTHLNMFLENMDTAISRDVGVCPDTGFPIFFVKLGDKADLGIDYADLKGVFNQAVEMATKAGYLRVTMVNPFTRVSSEANVGSFIPYIEYKPVSGDYLEITVTTKGGGAELFLPQPYRTLLLADGMAGAKKFIIDSVIYACQDGKSCPPNVIGIGIGGFPDLCMKLAKQAAVLRKIGDRHPEAEIARLEEELLEAVNMTGIGAMGGGGDVTAFDVHIEYAHTHTLGIPVAVNFQCALCRRATIRVYAGEDVEFRNSPDWFERGKN